jgi:hypothetical protein
VGGGGGGGPRIATFPFFKSNAIGDPAAVFPVTRILFLRGKGENRLEPLDAVRALPLFMRHVLQFAPDAAAAGPLLDAALATVAGVPCHALSFRKDASVVGFLAQRLGLPRTTR